MVEEELCTLPPGIDGTHAGALTISFRQCSVPNVVAHIKFWGGIGVNVSPVGERSSIATANSSITFALVGERSAIATYLRDASPLHIKILAENSALIGNVFIPDLSLPIHDCKRSSKGVISLHQTIIGDATFDLQFRLMSTQTQQPNLQHMDDFEVNQLLEQANGSEYQNSELCGSSSIAQEKYSLISELLDICTDDMTIPTVDTSIVADPYDSWISNIISSAASPPRTSLQSDETVNACEQPTETAASANEEDTFPHPISLFLSNVAIAANATKVRSSSTSKAQAEARVKRIPSKVMPPKLEPMQPPPIWIDIGVSNLRISAIGIGIPPSSIELRLKCNEPLKYLCDLVQSNAFGRHESSKYSSENVKIVEMPNECKELVSLPTQLSWQAGLKALNGDIEVTLQLRYCSNGEKVIAGHVSIPFQEQILKSSDTLGLLPRFHANGWFDILDPNNSASVGRIQLSLTSGTLKQIRSLPKAHKCAATIQRYWRKARSIRSCCAAVVGKRSEEPQSDEELSERLRTQSSLQNKGVNDLQKEGDDDNNTLNSHLPPPPPPPDNSDDVSSKQMQAESSPDSLFEEWSQQSFLHIDANEHEILNENSARVAENDGQAVDTSLVEAPNVDTGIRVYEKGIERNVILNTGPTMDNVTSDAEKLQDTFPSSQDQPDSHEDESTSRRRQPIDPPEEYDAPTIKRKIDQTTSFSVPDAKRHRHSNISQSEREVSSPPNLQAGAIDMSLYEEDSSDEDYRSLQSVMKSLADVEERLKCDNSSKMPSTSALGCQNDASISVDASVAVDDRSDLTPHTTRSEKSSQLQSSPHEKESSRNTNTADVDTCEKGTSPLCIPSQCEDASTSPYPYDYEERGRFEKQGRDGEEEDIVNKEVQDNETKECEFIPKSDDRSTLQLDWSLKKMTRNHSNSKQGLSPTLSTSDRRERYGSLFNSQSSYHHGVPRLSSRSLLSPTTSSGAPRLEGTGVDSSASGYRRYLSGRRNPRYEGVSSSAPSNSDRIEQIFSGCKKKKGD